MQIPIISTNDQFIFIQGWRRIKIIEPPRVCLLTSQVKFPKQLPCGFFQCIHCLFIICEKTFPSWLAADELIAKPVLYCQVSFPVVLLIAKNFPCAVPMKIEFPLTNGVDLTGASAKNSRLLCHIYFHLQIQQK